ncbi:hypothetical protein DICVIV_11676 [Dictyocaulus viviparus]|uniref:Uncharacterized protein n=1 Tax=Dictyocaulus viviparus TaxID=29172 RepID=A0A0D8XJ28_DICVI|nr:hypothetical protein DICVIV_11676 [Dictyocaulus viviparus]
MALGQYTSTGIYLVFDRMTPAFVGIAISALFINFLNVCVNHNVLIKMIAVASEAAFISSQMSWYHCYNDIDVKDCYAWPRNCSTIISQFEDLTFSLISTRRAPAIIYNSLTSVTDQDYKSAYLTTPMMGFIHSEIHNFEHWKKLTYPTFRYYAISAFIVMVMVYILTRTKKQLVNILTIALMATFCVLAFLLNVSLSSMRPKNPYANPVMLGEPGVLLNWSAWAWAVNLTLRNLKLGEGVWTFFGSLFNFHNNVLLDCLLVSIFMAFLPFMYVLFHVMIIDSYILERSSGNLFIANNAYTIRKEKFYTNPFAMVTALLDAVHIFGDYNTTVTFFYSFVVAITTLSNKIIRAEVLISAIREMKVSYRDRSSTSIVVVLVVLITTIIQLFFMSQNGYSITISIKRSVIPIDSIVVVLFELFAIGTFYGFRVFYSNTSFMIVNSVRKNNEKGELIINIVMIILWSMVIPIVTLLSLIKMTRDLHKGNDVLNTMYITITLGILMPIPMLLIKRMYEQYRSGCSFATLFKRNPDLWGPRLRSNRHEAEKAERMIRKWW